MVSWMVGSRTVNTPSAFMQDSAARMSGKVQLSTDGQNTYETAVRAGFNHHSVAWAMVIKTFGQPPRDRAVLARDLHGR